VDAPSPAPEPRADAPVAWGFTLSDADLADDDHDFDPFAGGAIERGDLDETDDGEPVGRPLGSWVHVDDGESHTPSEPLGHGVQASAPKTTTGIDRAVHFPDLPTGEAVRIEATTLRERLQVDAPTRAGQLLAARRTGKGLRGALGVDDG
jgi:hypothetical protein